VRCFFLDLWSHLGFPSRQAGNRLRSLSPCWTRVYDVQQLGWLRGPMKIFIAGATGVLGHRVVKGLVEAGHEVWGLSRSEENEKKLKELGATPRVADLFDLQSVLAVSTEAEAVLHLATAIPKSVKPAAREWRMNNRIRREGTENLIEAACQHACKLYIQESATFLYGDQKSAWIDESAAIDDDPIEILHSAVDMEELVQKAIKERNLPAIILRFGWFYAEDAVHTTNNFKLLKKSMFPVVAKGHAYWNMIHAEDAASAVLRAVEYGQDRIGEIYNICDDEPVTYRTLLEFMAHELNAPKPKTIPVTLAKIFMGKDNVRFLTASARCKNDKARDDLKWHAKYSTYRDGYPQVIRQWYR